MADNELKVLITSESDKLKQAMSEASQSVQKAVSEMKSSFTDLGSHLDSVMSSLKSSFATFGASLAAVFTVKGIEEAISAATDYAASIRQLTNVMGMTAEAASQMEVALRLIGSSNEEYIGINMRLERQMKQNEDKFAYMGVAIRDADGAYLNSGKVLEEVIEKMKTYKAGTDQVMFAMDALGPRGADLALKFLNLKAAQEMALPLMKQLGLEMSQNDTKAAKDFSLQTNALGMTWTALRVKVGMEVIPQLKGLMQILVDLAGPVINAVIIGVKALIGAMYALGGVAIEACYAIMAPFKAATALLINTFNALAKAASGDFKGAWKAITSGGEVAYQEFAKSMNKIKKTSEETRDAVNALFDKTKLDNKGGPTSGNKSYDPYQKDKKGKTEDRFAAWKEELEKMKEAEGAFFNFSLAEEKASWEKKVELAKGHTKELEKVNHEIFLVEKRIRGEAYESYVSSQKEIISSEKTTSEEKIAAAQRVVALTKETYREGSAQFRAAKLEEQKVIEQAEKKQAELQAKGLSDEVKVLEEKGKAEETHLQHEFDMGRITASKQLELQKKSAEDRYFAELQLLGDEAAALQRWPEEYKEALDKIKALVQKHTDEMQKIQDKVEVEQKKQWDSLAQGIGSAMDTALKGVIMGTTTLKAAMANLAQSILTTMLNASSKMAMAWITDRLREAVMGTTAKESESAAEQASAIETATVVIAAKKAEASSSIPASSAEAAMSAASAVASIPYAGPFLAVAVAASMMAMGMGYLATAMSAEGGYDIPKGVNPMTQLHSEEMVLPANLANRVRNMTGGGGGDIHNHHYHIQTWDSKDLGRFVKSHGGSLAKAGAHVARRFGGK